MLITLNVDQAIAEVGVKGRSAAIPWTEECTYCLLTPAGVGLVKCWPRCPADHFGPPAGIEIPERRPE